MECFISALESLARVTPTFVSLFFDDMNSRNGTVIATLLE